MRLRALVAAVLAVVMCAQRPDALTREEIRRYIHERVLTEDPNPVAKDSNPVAKVSNPVAKNSNPVAKVPNPVVKDSSPVAATVDSNPGDDSVLREPTTTPMTPSSADDPNLRTTTITTGSG